MALKKRILIIALFIVQFQFVIAQVEENIIEIEEEIVEETQTDFLPSNYYDYNKLSKKISDYKESNIYDFRDKTSKIALKKVQFDIIKSKKKIALFTNLKSKESLNIIMNLLLPSFQ